MLLLYNSLLNFELLNMLLNFFIYLVISQTGLISFSLGVMVTLRNYTIAISYYPYLTLLENRSSNFL